MGADGTTEDRVDEVRERQLQQRAGELGMRVVQSDTTDARAFDFGRYMIVDAATDEVVDGTMNGRPSMILDEVERRLLKFGRDRQRLETDGV